MDHLQKFVVELKFANNSSSNMQSSFVTGFSSWWKLSPKVKDHEDSKPHLLNLDKWKTLQAGLKQKATIDAHDQAQMENEKKKWQTILNRILSVVLYLAKQNLPFRGHREDDSSHNKGNFLELVELLSNYVEVLKEHLRKLKAATQSGKQITSYLSPEIQNEFICHLGSYVKEKIVEEIKEAKYFGIMFDSTPDISHIDQMSEVIRYVSISKDGTVEVKESFLGFFQISGKTAQEITDQILSQLANDGLDINMCRGQGYDNAATMAGIHGGVQAKIRKINSKAVFVPCASHSLNLCGVHAFSDGPQCVTFFGTLEKVYSFFSVSTHRWDILKSFGITVKKVCKTRWSASYEAVKAVKTNFQNLVLALEALNNPKENADTRGSAQILHTSVCKFSFLCYVHLWSEILEEVEDAQNYLQKSGLSLHQCMVKLEALKVFLQENGKEIVESSINAASKICEDMDISIEKRVRYKKRLAGDPLIASGVTLQEETKTGMFKCLHRFQVELEKRSKAFTLIDSHFSILQSNTILFESKEKLHELKAKLVAAFDDIDGDAVVAEIFRLRRHMKAAGVKRNESKNWTALDFLKFIVKWGYTESLSNLTVCFRIFLTVCVSVASCERSFSKLKLIKSFLRSTMGEERLTNLAILSIEHAFTKQIKFDEIISRFADAKVRRRQLK